MQRAARRLPGMPLQEIGKTRPLFVLPGDKIERGVKLVRRIITVQPQHDLSLFIEE
ncbi:hypothetical protein D3C83_87320 [compost metagenome]